MQIGNFSNSAGESKLYGALFDQEIAYEAECSRAGKTKKRLNCLPLLCCLILPWFTFNLCFAMAAFYFHYQMPITSVIAQILIVGMCLYYLPSVWRGRLRGADEGFYPFYLVLALLIASLAGSAMGDYCFWTYSLPAYRSEGMVTYAEVDPSSQKLLDHQVVATRGSRFQDAGKVYFKHTVELDLSRVATFKQGDVYCVAPIRDTTCSKNCGHDFWAVGKNCCSEDGKDFHCGDVENKHAKGGLRLMDVSEVPYYRLAVLGSTSKFKFTSEHPLFFEWMVDPVAEILTLKKMSYRRFMLALFGSFAVNAIVCISTMKTMRQIL